MIDQCIYEIYKRDDKVIIPDFGAIILSAATDKADFNDILTFDDGKVIAEIQKQQKLSEKEARNALSKYIQDLTKTLKKGKSKLIEGIGYLSKDAQGSFSINETESNPDLTNEKEGQDFEETVLDELFEQMKDDADISDKGLDEKEDLEVYEMETASTQTEENLNEEELNEEVLNEEALNEELINGENSEAIHSEEEEEQNDHLDSEDIYKPILAEEDEDVQDYYKRKDKFYGHDKKYSPYIMAMWIVIPILLLGLSAYYYFNYYTPGGAQDNVVLQQSNVSPSSSAKASAKNHTEQANVTLAKHVEKNEKESSSAPTKADVSKSRKPTKPAESPSVIDTRTSRDVAIGQNKTYSLILGSFREENNADRLQKRLREQGMEVSKFRRGNNLYLVGFEHIEGKSNAVRLLTEIKKEEPTAWIIRS